MAQDEAVLLQRFVASGDAGAFSEIVRRYASLVYSACMRILADRETAADATQETFFQLLKKANTITGSIPAWLHRVATGKAVDRIRTESARRRAEARYADVKCRQVAKWEDLSPHVDQALDALDAPSRDLLIEYFFKGRSLTDIAADKGISHPTVSRRVKAAINELRRQLRKSGIAVAAVTLGSLLRENAAQAAPAVVLSELAKTALAGAKLSGPAAVGGLLLAAKAKIIVVAAVVGIGAVGWLGYRHLSRPDNSSDPKPVVENGPGVSNAQPASSSVAAEAEESIESTQPVQSGPVQTAPEPQRPEPTPDLPLVGEQPQETAQEDPTPRLDLSSPEATVRTFIKRFVAGDAESVLACCLPGGTDYEDIQEILFADPADPQQRDEYQFRLWFEALDPDAEMPIISKEQTPRGISVTWLVTFKTEFAMPGRIFAPGEQMELDGTVVQSDGKWLIDGI